MKQFLFLIAFLVSLNVLSQDVFMGNGTFNRCNPDKFYDSGGSVSNYSSNENYVTTICAINPSDFIILNFTAFNTQLGGDVLSIYDGPDTSSPLIGSYSGGATFSPGTVSASPANTSGCLTLKFVSNATGTGAGFVADILCAEPCQSINTSIDSTSPTPNGSGVITILPGQSVSFNGSATFSGDSSGATYSWNFGDGSAVSSGQSASHTFTNPGTYNVVFTATDTNPQGCLGSDSISVLVMEPIISVNNDAFPESSYTPQQLIEDVLVSGGCSAVNNFTVQVKGNPTDFQTKSYGYFNKGGAVNFPFEEGIILSSGKAIEAGNSVTGNLVSTNNGLSGDADLETALGQNDTNDATYIKFNFVPTSNTISFRYIMASEEYDGNFECTFSDSFAFLLREVGTTLYTNLATLPNGNPVSVTSINNSPNCASYPNLFEGYNVPDTNYDGRTKVLTATANVTLGLTYEIKLVMADQNDAIYDSAIFLEAGSFVLGGELGNDITIATGNAECSGGSITLDTQAPNATHTWYKDGVVIAGETSSTVDVTETAVYSVDVFFAAGCETTDSVLVEFFPDINIDSLQNLYLCNPGSVPYNFDLTGNDSFILGSITDTDNYVISYHESQVEADSDMNSINNPEVYSGTDGQTIYARLEYEVSGCYDTSDFTLNIISQPTINPVNDFEICDDFSNDGIEQFDLETQTATILGGQSSSNFEVTYYASFVDADSESNPLASPYLNTVNPQPIFVRLESIGNANCTTISQTPVFYLVVTERATANQPNNLIICDDSLEDGFGQFNLLQQNATIYGSQSSADFSVTYFETQTDAGTSNNAISNPNSYTSNSNPQTIYARVFENTTPDCYNTTSFTLTVNPLPTAVSPSPLQVCDDNVADGLTSMDLTVKSNEISGGNPQYVVSYHLTQADADSGTSPLSNPYTNTTNPQTVYARVESSTTGCHSTTELELEVEQAPVANVPSPLEYCDADSDGFGEFDLTDADAEITGGASGLTVTYHETQSDAENNVNAQSSPYSNIAAYLQTLYVRVESATIATDCATFVELQLIVKDTPQIEDPSPLEVCDDNADGFAQFDLTSKNAEILGGLDATRYAVSYYGQQADADVPTNAIATPNAYTNTTAYGQTLWVRVDDTTNGCYKLTALDLVVNALPVLVRPSPLALCDVNSPGDQREPFTLEDANAQILNGQSGIVLTYHLTQADASTGSNPISSPHVNTTNAQTLFVRGITDSGTGCTSFTALTIRVLPVPTPGPDPSDIILCDDTNTGDAVEAFDLTDNENYIINGESGVTATYHTGLADAEAGSNAIPDPTMYTNTATPQTIHVRVTNDQTGCYRIVDFDIMVDPLPGVVAVEDYIICEVNTDGFAAFDLAGKTAEVLNGQDPALYSVTYHATQAGADNLTGALSSPYVNTSNPQPIYVAITNTVTGCSISTPSFSLEVDNGAEATAPSAPYRICDNVGDNDGLGQFDLTTQDAQVLNGQDPSNFIVTYYATQADAEQGVDPIPYTYENISNPQVIYVRVDNDTPDAAGMDSSICYAVTQLTLGVDLLPIFDLDDSYTLCVATNGTEVLGPPLLDTGLPQSDYTFEWSLDGIPIAGETGPSLTAAQGGTYGVTVTNVATGCTSSDSAEVEVSSPPTVIVTVSTQAFSENHVITAVATGDGVYEYSLDNGPWQDSGIFEGVSFGEHTVTARDTNGCGEAEGTVMVLDYPQFFTPNGDGRNETWNIVGFGDQASAKIYIFDRFGKLLKQISPSGTGWNGTYNGRPMPSSDYWFNVEYSEPSTGEQKQFSAHFTLKR